MSKQKIVVVKKLTLSEAPSIPKDPEGYMLPSSITIALTTGRSELLRVADASQAWSDETRTEILRLIGDLIDDRVKRETQIDKLKRFLDRAKARLGIIASQASEMREDLIHERESDDE
jgi:hypothetical protein